MTELYMVLACIICSLLGYTAGRIDEHHWQDKVRRTSKRIFSGRN